MGIRGNRFALAVGIAILTGLVFASTAFAAVTRYEQNDPSIAYQGVWQVSSLPGHSGGSVDYTSDGTPPVGQATFSFSGTGVTYVASKWYNRGTAAVSLDGGAPTLVDLYAPGVAGDTSTVSYQQSVYTASGLTNGPHTLTVTWYNQHNVAASSPYLITIDAFDVTTPDPPVVHSSASSRWSLLLITTFAGLLGVVTLRRRNA